MKKPKKQYFKVTIRANNRFYFVGLHAFRHYCGSTRGYSTEAAAIAAAIELLRYAPEGKLPKALLVQAGN